MPRLLILSLLTAVTTAFAQPAADPALEKKIDSLLAQMTLEEKVSLCYGGLDSFHGVERLKIPKLRFSDGPRGPNGGGPVTAFPSGVAFGATWDPQLAYAAGQVMGEEARAVGVRMLLGPGINILRDPLGGRFFEYYTEDPYLNARLTASIVQGIQSEGVAACIKHYAVNNREDNRNNYMSMVDDRTFHEIYLPGFAAAVKDGHAWSFMTAANGANGELVSDNQELLHDILKGELGFDGVVITDWCQTRSTEKAALAGLDVSMPGGPDCLFAQPLIDAVKAGRVPESVIDDKARRFLLLLGRVGLLDGADPGPSGQRDTPAHHQVARRVADESITLLKNDKNLLPLDPASLKKVLVIGPNADQRFCLRGLGGSSWVESSHEITVLAGLRQALGDKITYLSTDDLGGFQLIPAGAITTLDGRPGFQASYYAAGQKEPAIQRLEPDANFMWEMRSPDPSIPPDGFRARLLGRITPPVTGAYTLRLITGGEAGLYVDQEGGAPIAVADTATGIPRATAIVQLEAGKPYLLRIDYTRKPGDAALRLEWQMPEPTEQAWSKVDAAARAADTVFFVGGLDHSLDSEGRDRIDMHFPTNQQNIINRLVQANPRTVVVLINGSPMELGGWLPQIPAVVEAWYPGMEGGAAVADVLFGKINPSGRLPFSWPKKLADAPSHALGTQDRDRIDYKEGLLLGYRYHDTKNVAPEFPFGFGLGYTTFSYGSLQLTNKDGHVHGALTLENTGSRPGQEVVQIYVKPLAPSVDRPVHELKAFRKIALQPGESKQVAFDLAPDAFSYFDASAKKWKVDPGPYEIQAAASSRDIRSTAQIKIN